jgi:hypothetical protein
MSVLSPVILRVQALQDRPRKGHLFINLNRYKGQS